MIIGNVFLKSSILLQIYLEPIILNGWVQLYINSGICFIFVSEHSKKWVGWLVMNLLWSIFIVKKEEAFITIVFFYF